MHGRARPGPAVLETTGVRAGRLVRKAARQSSLIAGVQCFSRRRKRSETGNLPEKVYDNETLDLNLKSRRSRKQRRKHNLSDFSVIFQPAHIVDIKVLSILNC